MKMLKMAAAIAGIGMIGAGSTVALTSCGENKNIQVHFEQTPVSSIDVEDSNVNNIGNILLNVSIVNSKDGGYYPLTEIHEKVLRPDASDDSVSSGYIKIDETVKDDVVSIKFTINKKFETNISSITGMWSIVIWGKELRPWTTSFEVVKYT